MSFNRQWIYGNWKMVQGLTGLENFFSEFQWQARAALDIKIFPSFLHLERAFSKVEQASGIGIGAQDCSTAEEGAFTGEVSARSLKELQVVSVLVGHSERRKRVPESPQSLEAKVHRAKDAGLGIVFCIGESEGDRISGRTLDILGEQLKVIETSLGACLLEDENFKHCVAYEPVWAIGTGKVATADDIAEAHAFIRRRVGAKIPLLYGGSVNSKNSAEILRVPEVNGVLVGGASLKAQEFLAIAESSPFYSGVKS